MAERNRSGETFLKSIRVVSKSSTKSDVWNDDKTILTNNENIFDISNHVSASLLNSECLWTKEELVKTPFTVENGKAYNQQDSRYDVVDDAVSKYYNNYPEKPALEPKEICLPGTLPQNDDKNKACPKSIGRGMEMENNVNEEEHPFVNDKTSDYEMLPKYVNDFDDEGQDMNDEQCHGELLQHFSMSVPDLRSKGRNDEEIADLRPVHYYHIYNAKNVQITGENGKATINNVATISSSDTLRHLNILNDVRGTKEQVETELFRGGQKVLNRECYHPLVIFKGTGYGCSFSAKMLFERVVTATENEAKPFYLKDPTEMTNISQDENSIILVTDINGPTGDDVWRLNAWFEWLKGYLPIGTSLRGKLTVIMNIKDSESTGMRKHPIYEKYCDYIVDAAKKEFRPTGATKTKLLMAFMKQKNVGIRRIKVGPENVYGKVNEASYIDREIVDGIIPLLGSVRVVGKLAELFRSNFAKGLNILTKPRPEIVQRIRESYKEGGSLFLTLLAVLSHGGQLGIGEVNQMRNVNGQCGKFWYSEDNIHKQSKSKSRNVKKRFNSKCLQHLYQYAQDNNHLFDLGNNLERYARRLDGEFLSEYKDVFRFCDGRVHYSFLLVYCEMFPDAIEHCEEYFFYNFVHSIRNVQDFENDTVLKVDDRKLDMRTKAVMKRFEKEMMLRHVAKCMKHPLMSTRFFQLFMKFLSKTKHLLWKVLTQQDCDLTEPYSCLYHGMGKELDTFKDVPRNITEAIILHDKWKEKRDQKEWEKWTHTQETETLIHAAEMSNCQTFELMVDNGAQIQKAALLKAIDVGADKVIEFIQLKSSFNTKETFEIAQYAATKLSKEPASDTLVQILRRLISAVDVNNSACEDVPPLIHHAVQTNNTSLLRKLFDGSLGNSHVNINKTFKGETPLAMSTRLGLQTVTIILLDNGAKPNTRDAFMSVTSGQKEILDLFVYMSPQMVHATNKQKQTLLHIAAEMGNSTVIRQLIDRNVQVEAKDFNNETALSLACNGRHMHALRIILHAWNQRELQNDERVVMRAVQNADIELLELLMEFNFGVDFVNREFGVPLHVAIQYGLREMLQFLLSKGANPNIKQDGHCPVHVAAAKDDVESLNVLKEYGADMFALTDTKDSIIHLAADKNHVHFIEFVLTLPDCSSLIDLKNNNYETALHIACKHGSAELTKLLLKFGFNTKLPNKSGYFPEYLAEQRFQKLYRSIRNVQKWAPYADCVKTLQAWQN